MKNLDFKVSIIASDALIYRDIKDAQYAIQKNLYSQMNAFFNTKRGEFLYDNMEEEVEIHYENCILKNNDLETILHFRVKVDDEIAILDKLKYGGNGGVTDLR